MPGLYTGSEQQLYVLIRVHLRHAIQGPAVFDERQHERQDALTRAHRTLARIPRQHLVQRLDELHPLKELPNDDTQTHVVRG